MATPAPIHSGGDRFEIAETRVNVPPEMQCLQTADAALSDFASRYLAYRHPLRFFSNDPSRRCDTYYLSPWMVMAARSMSHLPSDSRAPQERPEHTRIPLPHLRSDRACGFVGRVPGVRAGVPFVVSAERLRRCE